MTGVLVVMVMIVVSGLSLGQAQLNVDLSKATKDPATGNYCVMQKVCITNPPEGLTSAGCAPSAPPGCECDPLQPADLFCDKGETCSANNCACLREGCDCDPYAPDPDSFCPNQDEKCKDDCTCGALLPDGCDCLDDSYCSGEDRCVGCNCQSCPASQPRSQVVNPPLVFVIDTTKSVKPDKDSIFNLTMKVVSNIMKDDINIPRYQLISFNDYGPDIRRNVRLELDTTDVRKFGQAAAAIKFESYNGGRDSKERLTQGLYIALQNALEKSLIVVFTDNGTKNLNLEKEILRLKAEKECEVFIVLTPEFEGRANGKSLPLYSRLGKVFLISDVGAESFLTQVEEYEENNCV